jgi:hypothetical protein
MIYEMRPNNKGYSGGEERVSDYAHWNNKGYSGGEERVSDYAHWLNKPGR